MRDELHHIGWSGRKEVARARNEKLFGRSQAKPGSHGRNIGGMGIGAIAMGGIAATTPLFPIGLASHNL